MYSTTSGMSARYCVLLSGDLRRIGDVIVGRVPKGGVPAALVGDWGEGKGGGGSVHDEQHKGKGEGGGCEGSYRREQYQGRALPPSTSTFPPSVSSDASNPEPSVLGRGTLAVSQAAVLASPYRGGRLGGRI